ncbi:MAG: response regulator [Chloroflexi bacterium]|nr:response regulator [Chloroflexota bacterium]
MTIKVMLADDEENLVALMTAILEGDPRYRLVVARNGLEAVELARREKPALLFLDVRMPGKDGLQVCRELKSNPETGCISIVMLTALAQSADRERAQEVGADDYITKPFSPSAILDKVEQVLSASG